LPRLPIAVYPLQRSRRVAVNALDGIQSSYLAHIAGWDFDMFLLFLTSFESPFAAIANPLLQLVRVDYVLPVAHVSQTLSRKNKQCGLAVGVEGKGREAEGE